MTDLNAPGALPELTSEDKTWAALSHASILLAVLSGGPFGPIAAFVIWLLYQGKSPFVRRQAMQSLVYQLITIVFSWCMWLVIGLLCVVVVGFCLIPLGLLINLFMVVYACYGAYQCSQGRDFSYWLIGDLIA